MKKPKTNNLVTKSYLTRKLNQLEEQIDWKMEKRFKVFKNDILEMKDTIVKEVKDMREEFDAHQYSHLRINETLEEHERRIKVLER